MFHYCIYRMPNKPVVYVLGSQTGKILKKGDTFEGEQQTWKITRIGEEGVTISSPELSPEECDNLAQKQYNEYAPSAIKAIKCLTVRIENIEPVSASEVMKAIHDLVNFPELPHQVYLPPQEHFRFTFGTSTPFDGCTLICAELADNLSGKMDSQCGWTRQETDCAEPVDHPFGQTDAQCGWAHQENTAFIEEIDSALANLEKVLQNIS
jgi:hypothetical protein